MKKIPETSYEKMLTRSIKPDNQFYHLTMIIS